MIFDVKEIEEYIRLKYDIEDGVEIEMFMNFDIDYGIYFRHKYENETFDISYRSSYQYLDMSEYKSYLRDEKLKQLGI